jgi:radical SAM superfamily enzyme YgiQ (UPF0313 family)
MTIKTKKPLKIGFVIPNCDSNPEPFRNQPLVALYLLSILENHFRDQIISTLVDLRGVRVEHTAYRLPENDVFLYSVATSDFTDICTVLKTVRSVYPKAINVAGGPHVNLFPDVCSSLFDTIVLGEGEDSVVEVINDIISFSRPKTVYQQRTLPNLDNYPYPDRKYTTPAAAVYKPTLGGDYSDLLGAEVIFSRGCPFNCHFCANKKITYGPTRFRSPEKIVEEIEYLKKNYNIKALALKDDNSMPLNPKIAKPFLEAIGSTNLKWRGQSRATGISLDLVQLAKDSGCVDLAVGIESVDEKVLKIVNKKINIPDATKYVKQLIKVGIGVRLHFVFGFPGESKNVVRETLDYIDEIGPSSVLLSLLAPMPGSRFFDRPDDFGIVIDTYNWEDYRSQFARFDQNEKPIMVFHYKDTTPFGPGKSNEEIIENYLNLQGILRNRGLNF